MALFRTNISWDNMTRDEMVYKFPLKNGGREINKNSTLTVRESQVAVFVHKGEIADIFAPGMYKLDTEILPILTKLASWKYAFQTPITLDIYFVNTVQFTDCRWGTKNPFIMRDPEFGSVRVRGFGSYAFRVDPDNVDKFLKELFGTASSFKTSDIQNFLKTVLVSYISDAISESKISVLDIAANTVEFNQLVRIKVQEKFAELGLILTNLFIENVSVPEEVEKALDERSKYGILGDSTDVMMKVAAAEAMKDAAKNPGNGAVGTGVGMGAGFGIGSMMAEAFKGVGASKSSGSASTFACPSCGGDVPTGAKFCPECGKAVGTRFCTECGAKISGSAKFCPECGKKL